AEFTSQELTSENVETVRDLDAALSSKRLIGYGGLLKEIHQQLQLDDAEEDDLVHVSEDDETANEAFEVMAKWHVGLRNYVVYEQT
ncbi:protein rep, partial [Kribbella sandramycini]|uniref:protein rep n=1 Tax=Kribbella sandramycini TaxID=60450 RepID=UPI0031CF9729